MKNLLRQFECLILAAALIAAGLPFATTGYGAEKKGESRDRGVAEESTCSDGPKAELMPYLSEVKAACRCFAREHCRPCRVRAQAGPRPILSCLLEKQSQTPPECQRALTQLKEALDEMESAH